jgi:sortase A
MTAVESPELVVEPALLDEPTVAVPIVVADQPGPAPASGSGSGPRTSRPALLAVAVGASVLAALVLGFVGYLVLASANHEQHAQLKNFNGFRAQLDGATAPVGPVPVGRSVALLDIPAMGLQKTVVVQGTTAGALMSGPGLRADTPLPGEAGVSVIYGRRTTFGAPFGRLPDLKVGDVITTTTGHGVARYEVTTLTRGGSVTGETTAKNRLVLVTADSSLVPHSTISVTAALVGDPVPDDGGYRAVSPAERPLVGDTSVLLLLLMVWSLALLATAVAGTAAALFWARWPAWLLTAPVVLAVVWNVYENAAQLLPNLL